MSIFFNKLNYDDFAKTFSKSRNNLKWQEINYFLQNYSSNINNKRILDIWCWNARLLEHFYQNDIKNFDYLWLDSSKEMIWEAKTKFRENNFLVCDMLELSKIKQKDFESIFFIASFHHLNTFNQRKEVLLQLKNIIKPWSYIFMTNWDLNSELNLKKYNKSIIKNSQNEFWSLDFNIKIWEFNRFYHSFCLKELEFLFKSTWYEIIENRLFENKKNIISIIKTL